MFKFSEKFQGADILDLETIGFVTIGLGQLSITYNWPHRQLVLWSHGKIE